MKTRIMAFVITGVIAMMSVSATAQRSKGTSDARKEIADGKKDLKEAKVDSAADYKKFKANAETKIKENQTKIADLKSKKSSESKELREKYDHQVLALEKKNNALRDKIKNSGSTSTSEWTSFKNEFKHDMDELGHAIKDVGVDNTK